MKLNSNHFYLALAALALTTLTVKSMRANQPKPQPAADPTEIVQRGKYLVRISGCTDCHTPKKFSPTGMADDMDNYLAGHPAGAQLPPPPDLSGTPWFAATAGMTAWTGPWGISYAANLTPDQHTGLGFWTEEMFIKALRTGKHMGEGRQILPPMPWENLVAMSDEDLRAVFAFLKTIPAVRNEVPQPVPPTGPLVVE